MSITKTDRQLSLTYLFVTNLLRILGNRLVIDRCVRCGQKTNIIGVSYYEGGLMCKKCGDERSIMLNAEAIKILRYGFMISEDELLRHEFDDVEALPMLLLMLSYLEFTYNFKIISKDLLK